MAFQTTLRAIRRACYFIARILGDVVALLSGPSAFLKRQVRKVFYRRIRKVLP